ncbi:MAG: helix-turn-helix transcriptional regulator [Bacillota bacterium]|nr:helix-turn-helix transcriptional regulator [Bacillota bacterium]
MYELNEKIRQLREELCLSQDELAHRLGYRSRSTIAKIESGANDIPHSKIKAFAEALETTVGELMGWERTKQLKDLYLRRIEDWTDNPFIDDYQKTVLRDHFSMLLLQYKELVNHTVDAAKKFNQEVDGGLKECDLEMLKDEWKSYLERDLEKTSGLINGLPYHLAQASIRRMQAAAKEAESEASHDIEELVLSEDEMKMVTKLIEEYRKKKTE